MTEELIPAHIITNTGIVILQPLVESIKDYLLLPETLN